MNLLSSGTSVESGVGEEAGTPRRPSQTLPGDRSACDRSSRQCSSHPAIEEAPVEHPYRGLWRIR